ncbi:MAG: Crp/Fnr family transcriptional regulator [Eubacteriales bacterium]|nr:Crp/Fnr family transcriptional regulator [Eubacteriales bacterium]
MEEISHILSSCWLFRGLSAEDIQAVLGCVSARRQIYEKQEILFHAGDAVPQAGIVLRGELHIFREDFWGNQTILAALPCGELFGEVFACLPDHAADVSVRAVQQTEVLYLDMQRLLTGCSAACPFHAHIMRNLITVLAQKNRVLNRKMHHLTQRSIRGKLLSYLSEQRTLCGQATFCIPFNRQQLADYLSVDRSALSAELSRLRREGILTYHKNQFTLCRPRADV